MKQKKIAMLKTEKTVGFIPLKQLLEKIKFIMECLRTLMFLHDFDLSCSCKCKKEHILHLAPGHMIGMKGRES